MSVAALARLATDRDETERGTLLRRRGDGDDASSDNGLAQYRDIVVHAVPTEVLAAYTALVGVVAGAASAGDPPRQYAVLRWTLLAMFTAMTPVSVYLAVRVRRGRKHRMPLVEMGAASAAAVGWFLAMPGSPLFISLHGSDGAVASACITVGVGFALSLVAPLLRRGATRPSSRPSSGSSIASNASAPVEAAVPTQHAGPAPAPRDGESAQRAGSTGRASRRLS